MMWQILSVVGGLALLVWSADRFVDGAAATARHIGISPLLIGMVVIGFGTSAPEIVVSLFAALEGNPGLALGNAYGSNIANIALILGTTALLKPITVHSQVLRRELPVLLAVTLFAWWLLSDGDFSRGDGLLQLLIFLLLLIAAIRFSGSGNRSEDALATETDAEAAQMALPDAIRWLIIGLLLLIAASRLVVWGAIGIATTLGVSDLIIGLTVVAIGTSLPELAAGISAVRKNEHDLALGNIIGSNLFNTLLVAGIAGSVAPHHIDAALLNRDLPLLAALTLLLMLMAIGIRGPGRINRIEGGLLLLIFSGYTGWLILEVIRSHG